MLLQNVSVYLKEGGIGYNFTTLHFVSKAVNDVVFNLKIFGVNVWNWKKEGENWKYENLNCMWIMVLMLDIWWKLLFKQSKQRTKICFEILCFSN